eukprot:2107678-Prymnesium_polylepis.1
MDYFSDGQLQRKELACGEIYYYSLSPPLSAAAQRLAPPPRYAPLRREYIERVEFASTHPSHGVIHVFSDSRLCRTEYDASHRFAGFTDTYAGRGVSSSLALPNITKCVQYVDDIQFQVGEAGWPFTKFRHFELERMQIYDMNKGEMLAEIRERWLVIRENKKRPQDAADEQLAKRAC